VPSMATSPAQPRRLHCDHRRCRPALECATGPLLSRIEKRVGSPLPHARRCHGQPSIVIAATTAAAKHSAPEKEPWGAAPAGNLRSIMVSSLLSGVTIGRSSCAYTHTVHDLSERVSNAGVTPSKPVSMSLQHHPTAVASCMAAAICSAAGSNAGCAHLKGQRGPFPRWRGRQRWRGPRRRRRPCRTSCWRRGPRQPWRQMRPWMTFLAWRRQLHSREAKMRQLCSASGHRILHMLPVLHTCIERCRNEIRPTGCC
jgi:hypothetical protein